jgi:hypothetical protein
MISHGSSRGRLPWRAPECSSRGPECLSAKALCDRLTLWVQWWAQNTQIPNETFLGMSGMSNFNWLMEWSKSTLSPMWVRIMLPLSWDTIKRKGRLDSSVSRGWLWQHSLGHCPQSSRFHTGWNPVQPSVPKDMPTVSPANSTGCISVFTSQRGRVEKDEIVNNQSTASFMGTPVAFLQGKNFSVRIHGSSGSWVKKKIKMVEGWGCTSVVQS